MNFNAASEATPLIWIITVQYSRAHQQEVELHALAELSGGKHVAEDNLKGVALRVHLVAVVERNVVPDHRVVDLLRVPAKVNPPVPRVNRSVPKVNRSVPKVNPSVPKVNRSVPKVNQLPNLSQRESLLDRAVLDFSLRVPEDRNRSINKRQSLIDIWWRYFYYFGHIKGFCHIKGLMSVWSPREGPPVHNNITSFYRSSCANNGKGALRVHTPETHVCMT
eukprot:8707704-Pyramimonas_sp.AAC.1